MPAPFRTRGRALLPRLGLIAFATALALGQAPFALARPVSLTSRAVTLRPQAWKSGVAEPGFACGSSEDRVLDVMAAHAAWQAVAPEALPTTQSYDRGDIAVIEDDGTMLVPSGPNL